MRWNTHSRVSDCFILFQFIFSVQNFKLQKIHEEAGDVFCLVLNGRTGQRGAGNWKVSESLMQNGFRINDGED